MNNQLKSNDHLSVVGKTRAYFKVAAAIMMMTAVAACNNTAPNNQQQQAQEKAKVDSLTTVADTLQSRNTADRVQLDQYMTRAAELDSQIRLKDAEIVRLKKANGKLARSNKELAAELKADKKLIGSLKDELNSKDKDYAEKLGVLENDKSDLMRKRDSILTKYNHVVALASVLHASNIRLTAIRLKKHGEVEKITTKARKADGLKIVFDIDENRIAENGTKQLYLVIKDPNGTLLNGTGSGTTTTSTGSKMSYSVLKEIALTTNTPVKDVDVDWRQEGDYEKGSYTIDIYNGGYRIGGGHVDLR